MKKIKGFTFVELLLVLLILGVIISLTLPIIKNIKDDDDIYRAYMKKANHDVTEAMNMIFIKMPRFTGMSMIEDGTIQNYAGSENFTKDSNGLRNIFNVGLNTFMCGTCIAYDKDEDEDENSLYNKTTCILTDEGNPATCMPNDKKFTGDHLDNQPGLVLGGKPVWVFEYAYQAKGADNDYGDDIYGFIYVDMNKDKKPNELCKDRYKFVIYNDHVAMDGCSLEL